ncbi:hypothetical protein TNCV_2870141 [Trichonephila clavipes]|nr:hypothetical protein TNCV_2870141 [Trichonephila clavipes]
MIQICTATHGRKHVRSALGGIVHERTFKVTGMYYHSHLSCHRPQRSIERFTNTELTHVHLIHGLAEGNVRASERVYSERYSQRRTLYRPNIMKIPHTR